VCVCEREICVLMDHEIVLMRVISAPNDRKTFLKCVCVCVCVDMMVIVVLD